MARLPSWHGVVVVCADECRLDSRKSLASREVEEEAAEFEEEEEEDLVEETRVCCLGGRGEAMVKEKGTGKKGM